MLESREDMESAVKKVDGTELVSRRGECTISFFLALPGSCYKRSGRLFSLQVRTEWGAERYSFLPTQPFS